MADFEETALDNYACPPRIWLRFVDDVLSVIQANQKATFLEHLNAQNKSIQFTMEEELDHSLPFMDVNFTREADGHLAWQVHQKSTHTNRYVQFDSHHPAAVKAGIIQCLTQRALTVCSSSKQCKEELDKIKKSHDIQRLSQQVHRKSHQHTTEKKRRTETSKRHDLARVDLRLNPVHRRTEPSSTSYC